MREILFRGKDLETGEWVYGYFVYCASQYDDPEKDRVADIIPVDTDRIYLGEYNCHQSYEIDINTLGQFTGLVDKNGTKIFEGDIIGGDETITSITRCLNTGLTNTVTWTNKNLRYLAEFTPGSLMLIQGYCREFEVIGNIYDNPELLERK